MPVTFNHTVIPARNRDESAGFFRKLFELPKAPSWGPFATIQLAEGVLLQFAGLPDVDQIHMHHYAFPFDNDLVDRAHARLQAGGTEHWADPRMTRPGETNTEHGGRGVYFEDPVGHTIEMISKPYL
ncbi:VOC family protein [Streptomyces sp. NPDC000348]|uniref:VOC family protein n=1 Tax=Streptomyces sp. NPDC000348 TaxID=3364538 RepID=UPI0036D17B22